MSVNNHLLFLQYVPLLGSRTSGSVQAVKYVHELSISISQYCVHTGWLHPLRVTMKLISKGKGLQQQAEVGQGVPGRLRSRILLTFGTTRVVGRQPYAPAAFTPGEIPGTHF